MVDSVRIKEIHACLGAGEFAYYGDPPTPYATSVAWNVDKIVKAFGINYNPDGTLQTVLLNPPAPPTP